MDVSVMICTRNRAHRLRQTLAALARMPIPSGVVWEVVVVDNGSTDDTADAIAGFAASLPVRRVEQPVPGLSNARNAGIDAAKGRVMAWIDDDILVSENWLSAYLHAFSRHPDAAVFGGRITPRIQPPTPEWFAQSVPAFADMLGLRDFGPAPLPLDAQRERLPFGGNYAIRSMVQRRHRYDPALGIAPGRRTGGEEIAVMRAILSEGGSGWWVPDAAVEHVVPSQHQTLQYVIAYYEATGSTASRTAITGAGIELSIAVARLLLAMALHRRGWGRDVIRYAHWTGRLKHGLELYSHRQPAQRKATPTSANL